MSVYDEIEKIKEQKLPSDLGDTFTAKVVKVTKGTHEFQGKEQPTLRVELLTEAGESVTTTFRIPKALTGKGQLDLLIENLEKMKLAIRDVEGKTFVWKRMKLSGSVNGNDRHYPVKVIQ